LSRIDPKQFFTIPFWLPICYNGKVQGGGAAIVKFCVLASSSSGNAAFIGTERTRILIDAGLSRRELTRRLAAIGEAPENVNAILLTHEHSDHVCGLLRFVKKFETPVYTTALTATTLAWEDCTPKLESFLAGTRLSIGDVEVDTFTIPHDSIDPIGFRFCAEGVRIGYATDLGYVPDSIKFHMRGVDLLMLESNHDIEMLKVGPYPWSVKQRVMSRKGHLSNDHVCDFIRNDLDSSTSTLLLGHLSENNNYPGLVELMAAQALGARTSAVNLKVIDPGKPSPVFSF
jgi:phosphoribosyl 1,2-cyclic phosphodiesterase